MQNFSLLWGSFTWCRLYEATYHQRLKAYAYLVASKPIAVLLSTALRVTCFSVGPPDPQSRLQEKQRGLVFSISKCNIVIRFSNFMTKFVRWHFGIEKAVELC